jgi:hypothetical protein
MPTKKLHQRDSTPNLLHPSRMMMAAEDSASRRSKRIVIVVVVAATNGKLSWPPVIALVA